MGKFDVLLWLNAMKSEEIRNLNSNNDQATRVFLCSNFPCYTLGWGMDDDVVFAEPQDVSTFRSESKTIKEIKPVNQVIKKATDAKPERKVRTVKPWCFPRVDNFQDVIGLE